MNRIVRIIAASTLTFGLLLCGTFAFAQKSPAFEAKFKIAEGADLRILDDNIWDYSKDTIPPNGRKSERIRVTATGPRNLPGS